MTQRTELNRFSLILIGWHAFYPETFLREESGDSYDDGWFDWKLHIKLSGAQDLNTFIEKKNLTLEYKSGIKLVCERSVNVENSLEQIVC